MEKVSKAINYFYTQKGHAGSFLLKNIHQLIIPITGRNKEFNSIIHKTVVAMNHHHRVFLHLSEEI